MRRWGLIVDDDLLLFLLLQVTVDQRDGEATRQGLRLAGEMLEDKAAENVAKELGRTIPGRARHWLSEV